MATETAAEVPLYFNSGGRRLFGWLHRPIGSTTPQMGLVICKPFGAELLNSHGSVRAFADLAVALGIPVLRFDFAGAGDSEDLDPEADQLAVWTADVIAVVAQFRQLTGIERVCLLGIRLGALVATLASRKCESSRALILVAPIISGRRYLRELRSLEMSALAAAGEAAMEAAIRPLGSCAVEASGALLSAATAAALLQVDLMRERLPPGMEVLVIDRSDLPAAKPWAEALTLQGVSAKYSNLPGFVEMALRSPHDSVIPVQMVQAAQAWLMNLLPAAAPKLATVDTVTRSLASDESAAVLSLPADSSNPGSMLTERPVYFHRDPDLFAVVTEPPAGEARRRGVLLLNAGADYHIGPHRMYVSLARQWARRGYVVMRMDMAGLGDSATRRGHSSNEVFPLEGIDDIRAAVDYLRARYQIRDLTLAGLCAGAYHSLRAAVAGLPVNRLMMINPLNFFWKQGMSLDPEEPQLFMAVQFPRTYWRRLASAIYWKRLLTGQINLRRLAGIYADRIKLALELPVRNFARRLHMPLPDDLGWELEKLAARGIRLVFIFSRGDAGLELLRIQGGSSVPRLGERCRVHIIDGADHGFTRLAARATLEKVLSDELFVRLEATAGAPTLLVTAQAGN